MTTPTWMSSVGDFMLGYAGQKPIYANGYKIGYWIPEKNNLCGGNAFINNEFVNQATKLPTIPPSLWITKDDLWRDIPVSEYCLSKGIVPSWSNVVAGTATVTLPNGTQKSYSQNEIGSYLEEKPMNNTMKFALIGGVGLAALLLLRR